MQVKDSKDSTRVYPAVQQISICRTILILTKTSYRGNALSEELLEYMLMVAVSTVNEYNNKFFMISEGELTVQQFIESEQASD